MAAVNLRYYKDNFLGEPPALREGKPWWIVVLLTLLLLACAGAFGAFSLSHGGGDLKAATVYIETPQGTGTGFLIRRDGYLLTNGHVVNWDQTSQVTVYLNSGESNEKKLAGSVKETGPAGTDKLSDDWALLKVEPPGGKPTMPFLRMLTSDCIKESDLVKAAGFPGGKEIDRDLTQGKRTKGPNITIEQGNIAQIIKDDQGGTMAFHHRANTAPGVSGGPVVNQRGRVIGMSTLKSIPPFDKNIALPTSSFIIAWEKVVRTEYTDYRCK